LLRPEMGENFAGAKLSILALDVSLHFGLVIPRGNEKIQKGVLIWGIKDLRLKEIREDELPRTVNLLQMLNDATESRPLQIDYGEYYEENVFHAKQMNQGKMLPSMMLRVIKFTNNHSR
ncbi:hypothetical protein, partial [Klebsiella pneumoniae]|uniref:hypothetical protein n=1 Tax=Klebsiella pneumoniae TaxID=573 RepID=UPI00358E8638